MKHLKYTNREISWLDFNFRVLQETCNLRNPIIERVKFLGITSKNLDDFFMIRVSSLQKKIKNNSKNEDPFGINFKKLYSKLVKKIKKFINKQYSYLNQMIIPDLKKEHIYFLNWNDLDENQKKFVENYFEEKILPLINWIEVNFRSETFPFLTNKSLNLIVETLDQKNNKTRLMIVKIPPKLIRYISLPCEFGKKYILIEEIIRNQMFLVFREEIKSVYLFRVTKNLNYEIEEDNDNILEEVRNSIRKCKKNKIIRLEMEIKTETRIKKILSKFLNIKNEIYVIDGTIDLSFYIRFANEDWPENFKYEKKVSNYTTSDFYNNDIFKVINNKDRVLYHPFDDFQAIVDFIEQASKDVNVVSIKQTLYRAGANSPIVEALINASENGKKVTAIVELKARFDEEENILWAQKLEQAKCKVIYGKKKLKIHCKITLVTRKEGSLIKKYVHLATGNYNAKTAKIYTDISFFTSKKKIAEDASSIFDYLTNKTKYVQCKKLIVSPYYMRDFFEKMIDREIKNVKKGLGGKIIFKTNSLTDKKITKLLYKASSKGVKIILIVRGACCLIPNVKNLSENIKVISIVGRFLEHNRIFYFENANMPKIYLGSADLMKRNLDKRVEVIFPVEDENSKNKILDIINVILKDNVNSYCQNSKAKYKKTINPIKQIDSQLSFFKERMI
ncbi:MAG: RNA degradosome polyphosphate kinase [Candidatus Improbicoccus pseudotrichonymphae]|uniref:Polyphosphate kinase n=1 Tax=Candidatus Improbicoccus pseudotrichonymphae TaxID=3033792 RepID=A0AA48HY55_9FIRM|nr:MAG: RNA degradosome polyphosphate kinase [Candidatus Improbicoccus pseudotrichonymphae]